VNDGPYPRIHRWTLAERVVPATWEAFRVADNHEAAVFWLGVRDSEAVVTSVVRLHGVGVEEGQGHFEAAPEVLGTVTRWAKPQGLTLLAICHVHPPGVPGRLSRWDRRHGFAVSEFLSIVAGDGGVDEPSRWGWYVFDRQAADYRLISERERADRLRVDPSMAGDLFVADARVVLPWQ
jgi:proteasome lid subunit RPN8/RPN11